MYFRRFVALGTACWMLGAGALAAQLGPDTIRRGATRDAAGQDDRLQRRPEYVSGVVDAGSGSAPLLDRPVSRSEYQLGPGDLLGVAVFGEAPAQYTLAVTPEGSVVIPEVGVARVLGLNLDEAEARIRALVGRYYRDPEVRVTLSAVRSFKVFVVGDIPERGVRPATAATRVSEIISPVGGSGVQRRNVLLRRASGDSVRLDLVRFVQTGDVRFNPTLREGDALVVPVVDETVEVFGRVAFPGRYEYRAGESLADFLAVANGSGGFPVSAADTIRVTRFSEGGRRELLTLSRSEAMGTQGQQLVLRPFDGIFVPEVANYRLLRTASVGGQVRFPGTYPIRPDTTTVRDLVAMAGGFTNQASLTNATLRREADRGTDRSREFLAAPDSALTRQERDIRAITREAENQSFVVVDLQKLFVLGEEAHDQPLQAGDSLHVPRRRNEVTVLGAVVTPGIVAYVPGASYQQYVRLAGGFSRRADRGDVSIIRAGQGNRVDVLDAWYPEPGDQIVVPFRERRTFLERVQGFSAVAGTISSAILASLALARILD